MAAYRSRMKSALDGLDLTPMPAEWRATNRTILQNNLAFMDERNSVLVPHRLVPAARTHYGFGTLPIDEDSALHVAKLPKLHGDPFDRMLVSQALVHGLTIATPDPKIIEYQARTIW